MERRFFLFGLLPLATSVMACDDCAEGEVETAREGCKAPQEPTPIPPPPVPNTIEFRVLGDILFDEGETGAEIQYGSTQEGTARLISTLPWFASTKTFKDNLFLVLNASATGFGFIQVQIIVNNELFREASAAGVDPKVSVSGLFSK